MAVLWNTEQDLLVQEVVDRLEPGHNYKTVMTVLNRLVDKELLERKLDGRAYRYRTQQGRDDFLQGAAGQLVQEYVDSYGLEAGSHLAGAMHSTMPWLEQPDVEDVRRPSPPSEPSTDNRSSLVAVVAGAIALQLLVLLFSRRGKQK
jgi:predicted transcriptional regulator